MLRTTAVISMPLVSCLCDRPIVSCPVHKGVSQSRVWDCNQTILWDTLLSHGRTSSSKSMWSAHTSVTTHAQYMTNTILHDEYHIIYARSHMSHLSECAAQLRCPTPPGRGSTKQRAPAPAARTHAPIHVPSQRVRSPATMPPSSRERVNQTAGAKQAPAPTARTHAHPAHNIDSPPARVRALRLRALGLRGDCRGRRRWRNTRIHGDTSREGAARS